MEKRVGGKASERREKERSTIHQEAPSILFLGVSLRRRSLFWLQPPTNRALCSATREHAQAHKLWRFFLTAEPLLLVDEEAGLPPAAAAARRIPKRPTPQPPPSLIFAPPERSPAAAARANADTPTAAAAQVARAKPFRRSGWVEACSAVS